MIAFKFSDLGGNCPLAWKGSMVFQHQGKHWRPDIVDFVNQLVWAFEIPAELACREVPGARTESSGTEAVGPTEG